MKTTEPKAPSHLQPATKRWFNAVIEDFELQSHHLRLLQLADDATTLRN